MKSFLRSMTLAALTFAVTIVGLGQFSGQALAQSGAGIPVIVMGEDSDPKSVRRDSDIFRRVVSSIQEQMSRYNFYVIDEEMLAARLGWAITVRRPKVELMQVAMLARDADDPSLHARAMAVFKIRAGIQNLGFANKAQVRITGDIFDVASNRFLGSWEAPRMEFPAPANCSDFCIEEVVGDKARDVAAQVGDVLRKKLAYLTDGAAGAAQGAGVANSGQGGLVNTYQVVFQNFSTVELLQITDVMETEFPQFQSARAPQGDTTKATYAYLSKAPANKLFKWMNILLMDMGLNPDSQVKIVMDDRKITLDKIFDSPQPAPTTGGKFN